MVINEGGCRILLALAQFQPNLQIRKSKGLYSVDICRGRRQLAFPIGCIRSVFMGAASLEFVCEEKKVKKKRLAKI